jgi:hypothetical protein
LSIFALVIFFLGGMYILSKVNIVQGIKAATDADTRDT